LGIAIIIAAAASLVLGGAFLALFNKVRWQKRSLGFIGHPPALQVVAAVGVLWSLGMIVLGVSLPLSWGMAVGLIVTTVDVVLLLVLRRQAKRPPKTAALARLQSTASQIVNTGIGTAIALIAPLAAIDYSGANLLTIMTRANSVLAGLNGPGSSRIPDFTMADLVRNAYLVQARLAVIMLVGSVVTVGLLMLVISGIIAFTKYRISRDG
jgi:hypothetical protein